MVAVETKPLTAWTRSDTAIEGGVTAGTGTAERVLIVHASGRGRAVIEDPMPVRQGRAWW
jgi:hypothetical protein